MARQREKNSLSAFVARQIKAHIRLLTAVALGIVAWFLVPIDGATTRALVAWNIGVWAFIVMALKMMAGATADDVQRRAGLEEEGRAVMLALVTAAAAATFVAIGAQLSAAKDLQGMAPGPHTALALFTIVGSWLFMNIAFAVHYAHEYHTLKSNRRNNRSPIIEFPGDEKPDYWDFLYFAMVIATTFQTSDVNIHSRPIRRTVLVQGLIAFFYNTAVIALTVNIAAQFFGGS